MFSSASSSRERGGGGLQDREARAVGVLLGLAAGDRIGGPVRMALRVAESVRDRHGVDVSDIGARYLLWWRDGAFDTGPTVEQVLSLVASGASFEDASTRVDAGLGGMTAGCNPAHRIAPIAMCASLDDAALHAAAVEEAQLTHRHPLAGEAAAVVARLCRALIQGSSWSHALGMVTDGRSAETVGALSRGGFAPDALRSAVHFVDASDSLSTALARSIDFAGPANYCPVLVGSIGGARWGCGQVTEAMLRHHGDLVPRLTEVALALGAAWRTPS